MARSGADRIEGRARRRALHCVLREGETDPRSRGRQRWGCCRGRNGRSVSRFHPQKGSTRLTDSCEHGRLGAAASLCSTLLTTPFDLLKTRRQLSPTVYTTLLESVKLVYRQNGLRGFWEGGGLRVVRKAGSAGIGWAVYEAFLGFGERRRLEGQGLGDEAKERKRSGGG